MKGLEIVHAEDMVYINLPTGIPGFHVTEIADAQAEPFPGFDNLLLSYRKLQSVMENPRFVIWREVLKSVQGIYLISDTSTGQLYVGMEDGGERILGRWGTYSKTGHGGNVALRDLDTLDISHRNHRDTPHRLLLVNQRSPCGGRFSGTWGSTPQRPCGTSTTCGAPRNHSRRRRPPRRGSPGC